MNLLFWATSEQEEILLEGLEREEISAESLERSDFGDDYGENVRCGNVYEAVPLLCRALLDLGLRVSSRGSLKAGLGNLRQTFYEPE